MNLSRIFRSFRYHFKKYLAMIFALIALIFAFGDLVTNLVSIVQIRSPIGLTTFWNILVYITLIYAFFCIYRGNKENSVESLHGVLMLTWFLIFGQVFSFILNMLFNVGNSLKGYLLAEDYLSFSFLLIRYLIVVIEIVLGILAYISLRNYTSGRYVSSLKVKVLFILFYSLVILGFAPQIYFYVILIKYSSDVFNSLIFLFSFYELFGSIASIFTVLRLPR